MDVGWIAGAAFWGFGISILFGGPLCDALGMRRLAVLAAAGHIGGTLLTVFAPNFTVLFAATLIIGIANGLVEAFVNPLITTLYSTNKTSRLVALHAWFPGGIVIGGLLSYGFTQVGLGWQAKMLLLLVPSVVYTVDVRRPEVPADRERGRRRLVRRHGARDRPAALSGDLAGDVADRGDRARSRTVVREHLQRGDAEQHRTPASSCSCGSTASCM